MAVRPAAVGHAAGEAEVDEVGVIVAVLAVEQDVARLDVAMHEAAAGWAASSASASWRGDGDLRTGSGLSGAASSSSALQVRAVDEAHGDEQAASVSPASKIGTTLGWSRPPQAATPQEPLAKTLVLREALGQDLQRDGASQSCVAREIDLTHPAAPDPNAYLIRAERGAVECMSPGSSSVTFDPIPGAYSLLVGRRWQPARGWVPRWRPPVVADQHTRTAALARASVGALARACHAVLRSVRVPM